MTKQHFEAMARIVNDIRTGQLNEKPNYKRAVDTAEVFIMLAKQFNDRFDQQRFMQACGLSEQEGAAL